MVLGLAVASGLGSGPGACFCDLPDEDFLDAFGPRGALSDEDFLDAFGPGGALPDEDFLDAFGPGGGVLLLPPKASLTCS